MQTEYVPVSIRFTPDMYEWLRKQAYEQHSKINTLVREAVEAMRKGEGKKRKGGAV